MKIAQIAPLQYSVPPPLAGGTERVLSYLVEELVGLGHSVTLFAADGSETSAELVPQGIAADSAGDDSGLRAVNEAAMLNEVARRAHEFDILHCHTEYYHAAVLAPVADRLLTTLHWRTDERDRQRLFARFPELSCVCISEHQQGHVPAGNRAGVIHNGLPADLLAFGRGRDGYLAFLGRMTDQKRPDVAIEIADRADLPLRLAGNVDPGNPHYFERRVLPRLGSRHDYLGEIDDVTKQNLLGGAIALLMPIDWPEPFGMVVIEAMACGTPIVAWKRGSLPELIDDGVNGFLVSSVEEAVVAVENCRHLPRRAIRQRFLDRFTSERMAREHARLYARTVACSALGHRQQISRTILQ